MVATSSALPNARSFAGACSHTRCRHSRVLCSSLSLVCFFALTFTSQGELSGDAGDAMCSRVCGQLRMLVDSFLVPLRSSLSSDGSPLIVRCCLTSLCVCSSCVLTYPHSDEFESLYTHVTTVCDLHRQLSEDLDRRIAEWTKSGECVWHFPRRFVWVSQFFWLKVGDLLKRYAGMLRSVMSHHFSAEREVRKNATCSCDALTLDLKLLSTWRRDHIHAREIDSLIRGAEKTLSCSFPHLLSLPSARIHVSRGSRALRANPHFFLLAAVSGRAH